MPQIIDISEILLELGLSSAVTEEERAIASAAIAKAEGAVRRCLCYDPVQRSRTEYYPQHDVVPSGRQSVWEVSETHAYLRQLSEAATSQLQLQHLPIRSSPAIDLRIDYDGRFGTQSGSFVAATQQVEGADFWPAYDGLDDAGNQLCRDGILHSAGLWPTEAGTVRIVYTAGYTAAELHGQDALVDAGPIGAAVVGEAARRAKKALVNMKSSRLGFIAGPLSGESFGNYSYTVDTAALNRLFGSMSDLLPETKETLESYINIGWSLEG